MAMAGPSLAFEGTDRDQWLLQDFFTSTFEAYFVRLGGRSGQAVSWDGSKWSKFEQTRFLATQNCSFIDDLPMENGDFP